MPSRFWRASGNALLPGCNVLGPAASSWTPTTPTNAKAVWIDPRDTTTMFTDTSATVQVSADGDLIAAVKDKFSGSVVAVQPTSGNRPLYRTGGGKPYIDCTGGSKWLESAAGTVSLCDASGQHWSVAAVKFTAVASYQLVVDGDASTRLAQFLRCTPTAQLETIAFNTAGTNFNDATAASTLTAGAASVLREVTSTTATEAFIGGVSNGSTAVTGALQSGTTFLTIGAHDAGATSMDGKIYGIVIYKGLPGGSDAASADTYFAALM